MRIIDWAVDEWRWLRRDGWSLVSTKTIALTGMGGQRFFEIWRNDQTGEIRKVERDWT